VDYNSYMIGVDLADMRRNAHTCRKKAYKWWHPIFYWILDTALSNAHIIANQTLGKKLDGSKFRLDVVDGLFEKSRGGGEQEPPSRRGEQVEQALAKRGGGGELAACRLMNPGKHWLLPEKGKPRRCALCMFTHNPCDTAVYDRKVSLKCKLCNSYLHLECAESFHNSRNPKSAFPPTDERMWPEKRKK